jgi:hypothetical protein
VALVFLFRETGFGENMLLPLSVSMDKRVTYNSPLNEVGSWLVPKAAWAESLDAGQHAALLKLNLKPKKKGGAGCATIISLASDQ